MEIKINGTPLNFQLENETTLWEVFTAVSGWLRQAGLVISYGRIAKHEKFEEPSKNWHEILIDSISLVEFKVDNLHNLHISHLNTLEQYLNLIKSKLSNVESKTEKDSELLQLLSELPELLHGILSLSNKQQSTIDLIKNIEILCSEKTIDSIHHNKLLESFNKLQEIINQFRYEISNPTETINQYIQSSKKTIEGLSEVAVFLQTGDDKVAMKLLIEFTDATQSLMRSIVRFNETLKKETTDQKLINNLSPSEFFSGLYKFLHQIETAFDQKDSILIGDLLEYEVAPMMHHLLQYASDLASDEK